MEIKKIGIIFDDLLISEGRKKTKQNFAIVFFNK